MRRSDGTFIVFALGALLLWSSPTAAQTLESTQSEAERVAEELETERARGRALEEEARALSQELEALRIQLVTAAQTTRDREALIQALELQIEDLGIEADRRRADLAERHRQLTGTLGALTGLAQDAPRAFFLYPGTPMESVRGSMLLQSVAPAIGQRAAILREDLAALNAVREDLSARRAQLDQEDTALVQDRAQLEALLDKKRALYAQTADQARRANERLRALAERSENLKDLLEALREERRVSEAEDEDRQRAAQEATGDIPPPTPPSQSSQDLVPVALPTVRPDGIRSFPDTGAVAAPVVGRLVQHYGQDTGFGQTSKGIVVETRPSAAIVAPYDGKAVFAGQFRDLGLVLIIEHDGGYHTVLAGFARVDVSSGHWVLAGEPVGTMPQSAQANAALTGGDVSHGGTRPRLYMELRRDGQPVNPLRWITAGSIGIKG